MADITKLQLYIGNTTDKIAVYSTESDSSGIGAGYNMTVYAATNPSSGPQIGVGTLKNPYGKRCLPTLSWSLDGVNYYPQAQPIYYYNSTLAEYLYKVVIYMGCSDSTIYLCSATEYTADQTVYLRFALDSPS